MTLDELKSIEWEFPWGALDGDDCAYFESELHREMCPAHALYGKRVTAVARGGFDNDDNVIYFVHDTPARLAVVHLTFCHTRETDPTWPSTALFDSIPDLLAYIRTSNP